MDSFPDSSEDVLNDLDPLSRALLDLSVQRGMDDAEIAQVLGTDEESVFEVRVGLLRNLAEQVAPEHAESELPELQAAVAERLYAEPEDETAVEADDLGDEVDEAELEEEEETDVEVEVEPAEPALEPEPDREPEPEPEPVAAAASPAPRQPTSRRRSWLPVVLPILLLLAVVAFIIAAGSGDDGNDDKKSEPTAQQAPDKPKPPPEAETPAEPKRTRLTSLGSASGTASLDGDTLTMSLKDLPAADGGTYTVWLYNSIIDAKKIGTVKNGKVEAKLPSDADKYEFVDVSVEPKDGNANHSGQSVLRVPLKKLEQSG